MARRGHRRRQSFAGLRHIPKGGSLLKLHQSRILRKRAEVEIAIGSGHDPEK